MVERGIDFLRIEAPSTEAPAAARQRLGPLFPRAALRRMSQLGLLVGSVLDGWQPADRDAIYYASANAEARSLEDYLTSFPLASPLLFQTSVHPSAVQQVLIGRQQAVGRYVPMAGAGEIVEQALLGALLDPAPRCVFVGGEEQGSWLAEAGAASRESFAFALGLVRGPGTLGTVRFSPGGPGKPACLGLRGFTVALGERTSRRWNGPTGSFEVTWR